MQILFVPMADADIELMLPLFNSYVRDTTATLYEEDVDVETMRKLLFPTPEKFGSWKIVIDGKPVGYASLAPYRPREAYGNTAEVTVYLDPSWPGKGVGTQALAFVEYRARERAFHSLVASICAENAASLHTFQKQGYHEVARFAEAAHKFGRYLDVVWMQKHL
ncbi:MAG: N-acetyltransferase family protein [Spirochaetales bacterium]